MGYYLQILHLVCIPIINDLNELKFDYSLKWSDRLFQTMVSLYHEDFWPNVEVFILRIFKIFEYLKLCLLCLKQIKLSKHFEACLFRNFKVHIHNLKAEHLQVFNFCHK
jgi:hypothetical protein